MRTDDEDRCPAIVTFVDDHRFGLKDDPRPAEIGPKSVPLPTDAAQLDHLRTLRRPSGAGATSVLLTGLALVQSIALQIRGKCKLKRREQIVRDPRNVVFCAIAKLSHLSCPAFRLG